MGLPGDMPARLGLQGQLAALRERAGQAAAAAQELRSQLAAAQGAQRQLAVARVLLADLTARPDREWVRGSLRAGGPLHSQRHTSA